MNIARKSSEWINWVGISGKDFHIIEYAENCFLLHIPTLKLFENRIVRFLKEIDFWITVSMDGSSKNHDNYKKYTDGSDNCKNISKEMEIISGHPCYIIEITSVEIDPGTHHPWDAKVWVDPIRGFRPLKIEKYLEV